MKIALICDTHFGKRSDNLVMLEHFSSFFKNQFFPYLKKNDIRTVYHLGDVVDRRKYMNYNTLNVMRTALLEPLKAHTDAVHIIAGNHDVYYKDTNALNSLTELLGGYNFNLYVDPAEVNGSLLVPWINPENMTRSYAAIKASKAKSCFGHLEITGFEMSRGAACEHGISADLFKKFDVVGSGHFHLRSSKGNIQYLGSPYEMDWGDYNSPKGFSVFDTDTQELTFIPNNQTIFEHVIYDGVTRPAPDIKNKFVKLLVKGKPNHYDFEKFIDELELQQPADLRVIEEIFMIDDESEINQAEDTGTILKKYIDGIDLNLDKTKMQSLFVELYNEALMIRD